MDGATLSILPCVQLLRHRRMLVINTLALMHMQLHRLPSSECLSCCVCIDRFLRDGSWPGVEADCPVLRSISHNFCTHLHDSPRSLSSKQVDRSFGIDSTQHFLVVGCHGHKAIASVSSSSTNLFSKMPSGSPKGRFDML